MRALIALVGRLLEFQIGQRRSTIAQIWTMIADFDRKTIALDRDIRIEEDRANNHDPYHFAYPTYAKAAIQRRENLMRSSRELKVQLDAATKALDEAVEELRTIHLVQAKQQIERIDGAFETCSSDLRSDQHQTALV